MHCRHLVRPAWPQFSGASKATIQQDDIWANTYFLVTEPWAETSFQRFFVELGASKTGAAPGSKWHIPGQLGPWPSIVQQCVLGLQHLHNNLIRHKDLKPENILLLDEANGETEKPAVRVIIADLGISKPTIVDTTSFDGTRQYMAPEQLDGLSSTAESDVFSLGACFVIIQAILCTKTGLRPWMKAKQGQTSFFAIDKLAKGGFAPNIDEIMQVLREMHQNQVDEVDLEVKVYRTLLLDIVSQMVEVDPQKRPNANALCDILETYHEQNRPPIKNIFIKLIITSESRSFQDSIDISAAKTDKELLQLLNQRIKSNGQRFILEDIERHLQQYQSVSQIGNTAGNYPSNNNTVILELYAGYSINVARDIVVLSVLILSALALLYLEWYGLYRQPSPLLPSFIAILTLAISFSSITLVLLFIKMRDDIRYKGLRSS